MKRMGIVVLLVSIGVTLSACNRPAILTAASHGQTSQVKALLGQGVDINLKDSQDWTPLMAAAFNGRIDTVKLLLAEGADVNLENDDGLTALKLAKGRRHGKIAELLKADGAKK